MNKEEIDRRLLILTEASVAFDASHLALQLAEKQNIENREQVMLDIWRKTRQAEQQYNKTVAWLADHSVSYVFDQQQERYVELTKSQT